jgi:hypothetical protein
MAAVDPGGIRIDAEGEFLNPRWRFTMKIARVLIIACLATASGIAAADGPPYPEEPVFKSTKSRAEVIAETLEAIRLGLVMKSEGEVPVATPEQEKLIAEAGRRAAEASRLASK